jgi:hypothetical protein
MSVSLLSAFNDHFMEFVDDILRVFPDDHDLLIAKNSFIAIRKANPKLIIKIWNSFIVSRYGDAIAAGNLGFFVDKDYSSDVSGIDQSGKIVEAIDRLRNPIKLMSPENQEITMKYIQNLSKISAIYESQ